MRIVVMHEALYNVGDGDGRFRKMERNLDLDQGYRAAGRRRDGRAPPLPGRIVTESVSALTGVDRGQTLAASKTEERRARRASRP
jgi:hypothetical protein